MKNQWLEIDKEGLRKSLGQKDKVFLLTEMVSNAWDEDITQVEVSLSSPDETGFSWLRVTDNSPTGWADLTHSHTMFAESVKKGKSEKRGRFNAGEKDVLALAIEAKLTTVKGQVLFNEDGTRTEGTETREIGSEFVARFRLTLEEYEHICNQATLLIPPKGITTLFNGNAIQDRKPCGSFTEFLPIPLADKYVRASVVLRRPTTESWRREENDMTSRKRTNFITQLLHRVVSYIKRPKVGQHGWWWSEHEPMCIATPPMRATVVSTKGEFLIDLGDSHGLLEVDPSEFKTTPEELVDRRDTVLEGRSYFGLCPMCLEMSGYINIGSQHWFYCNQHGTKWYFGSNLFSTWKDQPEKEQKGIFDELDFGSYTEIEPWRSPRALQRAAKRHGFRFLPITNSDLQV
jgi:hypothetical protein